MQFNATNVCPHVSPKHLPKPLFPNCRDINKFSLRRVKNSCCCVVVWFTQFNEEDNAKECKSSLNLTVVLLQQWSHTWVSYRATENTQHQLVQFNSWGILKKKERKVKNKVKKRNVLSPALFYWHPLKKMFYYDGLKWGWNLRTWVFRLENTLQCTEFGSFRECLTHLIVVARY